MEDVVSAQRRRLPMVRVETGYRFDGERGGVGLLDLTPYGRQETLEDSPAGWPQTPPSEWMRLHVAYETS